MWTYLAVAVVHAGILCAIAWWHIRAGRKAAHASRRRTARMVNQAQSRALKAEVEYLQHRNEILMRGLFPRGDVFPGNFIDENPELIALCEVIELVRGQPILSEVKRHS